MIATSSSPLPDERSISAAWLHALEMTSKIDLQPQPTFQRVVVDILGENFADAPALFSSPENFSHAQLAGRARPDARQAFAKGIAKGEVTAEL